MKVRLTGQPKQRMDQGLEGAPRPSESSGEAGEGGGRGGAPPKVVNERSMTVLILQRERVVERVVERDWRERDKFALSKYVHKSKIAR